MQPERTTRIRISEVQLDHFLSFVSSPHIVQDLPFGQKHLHLSSGEIRDVRNVIRSMIPQRIVEQYTQYCKETSFQPLSPSMMLRILADCSATIRKSLQGLDYYAAEGAKAFDDLARVVNMATDFGFDKDEAGAIQDALKMGRQYLKGDFKVSRLKFQDLTDHKHYNVAKAFALWDMSTRVVV